MREKAAYRDNLAQIAEYFGEKRVLSVPDVAKYCGCTADVLYKDERFRNYTFKLNTQTRITTASLARWMT